MTARIDNGAASLVRIRWTGGVMVGVFGVLLLRVLFCQTAGSAAYFERGAHQYERSANLRAYTGAVLDRDGMPIVRTRTVLQLRCDTRKLADRRASAVVLAETLGVPAGQLEGLLTWNGDRKRGTPGSMLVWDDLNQEQSDRIAHAMQVRKTRPALDGMVISERSERVYSMPEDAAHITGMVGRGKGDVIHGRLGVQQKFTDWLFGCDGRIRDTAGPDRQGIGGTETERREPRDGMDIRLTLDSHLQRITAEALRDQVAASKAVGGCAIILDVRTGEVLAMASMPTFNPETKQGLSKGNLRALSNMALGLYEPGSTLKVVTAAIALNSGKVRPDERFDCAGKMRIRDRTISCAMHGKAGGHGSLDYAGIIQHSCNLGAAHMGMRLGLGDLKAGFGAFGLLSQTGVDLGPDYRGRMSLDAEVIRYEETKSSRAAFGQSVLVTPLGLASAYATIANSGVAMRPRLVSAFIRKDGKVEREIGPESRGAVIRPQTAKLVMDGLRLVVTKGTGKAAAVPGYTTGGKTGTAQKVKKGTYASGAYIASFYGVVPMSNPRLVIAVVVDEPQGEHYGSLVAAPVFRKIAMQAMWYLQVPPDSRETLQSKLAPVPQAPAEPQRLAKEPGSALD